MKQQIHVYRGHGDIAVEGHNIKLGRGGIREIEFFVQTQQLIAGGRHLELRGRRTLDMLAGACARSMDQGNRAGESSWRSCVQVLRGVRRTPPANGLPTRRPGTLPPQDAET